MNNSNRGASVAGVVSRLTHRRTFPARLTFPRIKIQRATDYFLGRFNWESVRRLRPTNASWTTGRLQGEALRRTARVHHIRAI